MSDWTVTQIVRGLRKRPLYPKYANDHREALVQIAANRLEHLNEFDSTMAAQLLVRNGTLERELSTVKAERDAAVADLAKTRNCSTCRRRRNCPYNRMGMKTTPGRYSFMCWVWRGIQPERGRHREADVD